MPERFTVRTVSVMRISNLLRAAAITIAVSFTLNPTPAHAVLCEDGWMSPSGGGPGTCSWHGGIAGNDNDRGWGGWSLPSGGGSDGIEIDDETLVKLVYGGGALLAIWWVVKSMQPPKEDK